MTRKKKMIYVLALFTGLFVMTLKEQTALFPEAEKEFVPPGKAYLEFEMRGFVNQAAYSYEAVRDTLATYLEQFGPAASGSVDWSFDMATDPTGGALGPVITSAGNSDNYRLKVKLEFPDYKSRYEWMLRALFTPNIELDQTNEKNGHYTGLATLHLPMVHDPLVTLHLSGRYVYAFS